MKGTIMKKLLLALVAMVAFIVTPASAADARPTDPQSNCVGVAMATGDLRAAVDCGDSGGATANSRSRNIDWD